MVHDTSLPFIAGIGSSAGGIEALIELVSSIPPELNVSFIIAQHLSPNHKSQMAEILSRETPLPVIEITDGCCVDKGKIYIAPSGNHIRYRNGHIYLQNEPVQISPKPSVNILLESLADEIGDHAIGIILSGTGSDGTLGLKAVKSVGGFTIVQDPDSAKYDGMPSSAISAMPVDKIVSPDVMANEVANFVNNISDDFLPTSNDEREKLLNTMFELIRAETKIDFGFYKRSTLLRRINRRVIYTNTATLEAYLELLKENSEEIHALSKELLISVTNFFRESTAFKDIKYYISEIVRDKKNEDSIRIWVPGCATGEEAYSIAILFIDELKKQNKTSDLRVFATDIDDQALQIARKGCYSEHAVNAVDNDILEKYFHYSSNTYTAKKKLRERITFSRQDITRDPPFLHLDMVTFRNVMIYFNVDLQARVLSILRYALNTGGILFLGKSESIGLKEELFVPVDRKSRIFRASLATEKPSLPRMGAQIERQPAKQVNAVDYNKAALIEAALVLASPCMLINENFKVLQNHGNIKPFIHIPDGAPESNLTKLIAHAFSAELVAGVAKAKRTGDKVKGQSHAIETGSDDQWYMTIMPVYGIESERFLVHFSKGKNTTDHQLNTQSEDVGELLAAREQLQTLTEEMAASAEEMQALNEEVQAANEELQANNEELEATNEELHSTNEELLSVNEENARKTSELSMINIELESTYNTIDFPIFVFDTELRLKRSNDVANRKYHLNVGIYKKSIHDMNLPDYFTDIEKRMRETLSGGGKMNFIIQPAIDETYNVFITPVTGIDNKSNCLILALINNSELAKAHNRVEKSQEQLLAIMNNSLSLVALKDSTGRYEFVNARFEELFGLNNEEVIGKTDKQLFDEAVARDLRERDLETMRTLLPRKTVDEVFGPKGKVILESVRFPIFDSEGTIKSVCTQANDISGARHANEQLKLAGKLFDRAGEAILITDSDANIVTANQAFTDFLGYSISELSGLNPRKLASGQHSDGFFENMYFALETMGYWQGEIINRRKSGEELSMWLTINVVKDASGSVVNYVATYSDINEIKSVQRKIEFLATHDELTKLPSRNLLMERLDLMLSHARRQETLCAVLFFDLDDFKNINDSLGHDIGDELLRQVAKRLRKCIRDTDILARMGGDEFVAVVSAEELSEIKDVSDRIIKTLSSPFEIIEHTLFVSASMGIAIYPADGDTNFALLKNADTAMYRAKELGRNQYQYFTEQMRSDAEEKMQIEQSLRDALKESLFEVVYQPKVDTKTGNVIGAEALLRGHNGALELISPSTFIEVAEKGRLIDEIGLHVLSKVLSDVRSWQDDGLSVPNISVNVSSKQLKNNRFITQAKLLLDDFCVKPEVFTIEVTETALMEKVEKSIETLSMLSDMGMSISVDDFGVGQSSLTYLRKLPINELKIDQSFIRGMVEEQDDRAITRTIIRMGHALGLKVVAEGVETEAQLHILRQENCDVVQGYHFFRPMPAKEFRELIKSTG